MFGSEPIEVHIMSEMRYVLSVWREEKVMGIELSIVSPDILVGLERGKGDGD